VAVKLADYFAAVYATDISPKQLANAPTRSNIFYKQEPAEHTSAPDNFFNLVTVAQAIHWFNFDLFYAEVNAL
jgi:ubiquinone/menaquinone biosynthesis C-methylase UbiE